MSLDAYLAKFTDADRVTLVGPMLAQPLSTPPEPLVWVDGGVNHRREAVGFAVGDGDSAAHELDQYLPLDKDYSDLAYVLERLPKHFVEVILLGFLGARRDHELFNLGEAHHFLSSATSPTRMQFDHDVNAYSKGEWRFDAHAVFSLAVFAPTTLTLCGACQYQLPKMIEIAPLKSFGLSNRGFGEVILNTHGPTFIFMSPAD